MKIKIPRASIQKPYCFASMGLYSANAKRDARDKWLREHSLFMAEIARGDTIERRVVTTVHTSRRPFRIHLMDAVTGTIYDPRTKRALSSDQLNLVSIREDSGCEIALRSLRAVWGV